MTSIQDRRDGREIALDRVGVTGLTRPVQVPVEGDGMQTVEGRFDLFVSLGPIARGVHMSRFARVLADFAEPLTPSGVEHLLDTIRSELGSESAFVDVDFTFFVEKKAPVSGATGLMACPAMISASLESELDFALTIEVPVMTVCPCSQEATGGPGHSQRGYVTISVRFDGHVDLEELVEIAESCASAPVYPLLTGDDERVVIDTAIDNPVFVEDLVRGVAERLDSDVRVHWYRIEAENSESVSDHNVYAAIECTR
jgi:GTP cyclohydrolase I